MGVEGKGEGEGLGSHPSTSWQGARLLRDTGPRARGLEAWGGLRACCRGQAGPCGPEGGHCCPELLGGGYRLQHGFSRAEKEPPRSLDVSRAPEPRCTRRGWRQVSLLGGAESRPRGPLGGAGSLPRRPLRGVGSRPCRPLPGRLCAEAGGAFITARPKLRSLHCLFALGVR